jgi:hypothetical protein
VPSLFPFGYGLAVPARWCAPLLLAVASLLFAGTSGCGHKTVHAVVAKPVPPRRQQIAIPPPPDVRPAEPGDLELAYVTPSLPAPPPDHSSHTTPPAHRAPAEPASRPAPPQISPQISSADRAAFEHRTNDSINEAEKNLKQAGAHQLSSSQQEMVEKIQGFIAQAREALQASDHTRAQNLAQKAQLLSVELVSTF